MLAGGVVLVVVVVVVVCAEVGVGLGVAVEGIPGVGTWNKKSIGRNIDASIFDLSELIYPKRLTRNK
jgi:hypothetical protein